MSYEIERPYPSYIFHRFILFTFSHFLSFTYGGLGVRVFGLGLGFWVWDFQSIEFRACGVGLSEFFDGFGSL